MVKKSVLTQQKITETARELFIEKGFDGVKMQELADRAGVNKGLLHHYFINKQTLFNEVFAHAIEKLFIQITHVFTEEISFDDKISKIVDAYNDMLLSNPRLPVFIVFEINRDATLFDTLFTEERMHILIEGIKHSNADISEEKAINLILTVASLSFFPFMAKPIVMKMTKNEKAFRELIEKRRSITKLLVSNLAKSI